MTNGISGNPKLTSVGFWKQYFLVLLTAAIVSLSNQVGYSSVRHGSVTSLTTQMTDSLDGTKPASGESPRGLIVKVVIAIRKADYEDDRAGLNRLFKELESFIDDKKFGSKARYWRGFAMWRRAFNGVNDSIGREELEADLQAAVAEFETALNSEPNFVDAKVGAVSCLLTLVFLHQKDEAETRQLLSKAVPLLNEAKAAEPKNPRLLWVLGSSRWFLGPEKDGGQDRAIETYLTGLEGIRERTWCNIDRLIPSWGEPELLMNLAWSNLNKTQPDLPAAEQYARAALAIVPHWHYVRDILLPQITAAKGKKVTDRARLP
jgi:hypothetical protein